MERNGSVDVARYFTEEQEIVVLVVMEMTMGVVGIFINLMVVSSVRSEDTLQESTKNLLLANICFSNLVVSFLVKPISAIYVSYALSTGDWNVGLAFCTLYTLSYRTTWLVYPFSILALCWNSVTGAMVSCHSGHSGHGGHGGHSGHGGHNTAASQPQHTKQGSVVKLDLEISFEEDSEFARVKRAMAFPTARQKCVLSFIWIFAILYGLAACFPEKVKC